MRNIMYRRQRAKATDQGMLREERLIEYETGMDEQVLRAIRKRASSMRQKWLAATKQLRHLQRKIKLFKYKTMDTRQWRCTPLIPELGRQWQVDF